MIFNFGPTTPCKMFIGKGLRGSFLRVTYDPIGRLLKKRAQLLQKWGV